MAPFTQVHKLQRQLIRKSTALIAYEQIMVSVALHKMVIVNHAIAFTIMKFIIYQKINRVKPYRILCYDILSRFPFKPYNIREVILSKLIPHYYPRQRSNLPCQLWPINLELDFLEILSGMIRID